MSAELKIYCEEKAYRIYISDSLFYFNQNKRLAKTYAEIIGVRKTEEDTRSGDEIALDVINKIGLEVHH